MELSVVYSAVLEFVLQPASYKRILLHDARHSGGPTFKIPVVQQSTP